MSNRRKTTEERQSNPRWRTKARRNRGWFNFSGLNMEFMKGGLGEQSFAKDRTLNGKDRIRARRAANREARDEQG